MAETTDTLVMTADLVCAFVGANKVAADDLPELIRTVHQALASAGAPLAPVADVIARPTAAQIRKSVTREALISFEDGQPYRTLRRHLGTRGLTVAEYRTKWGLPDDYPSSAAAYSEARSAMAKAAGLGQRGRKPAATGKAAAGRKTSSSDSVG